MNQIERIHNEFAKRFPNLAMNLHRSASEKWPWFLFVNRGKGIPHIAIEKG